MISLDVKTESNSSSPLNVSSSNEQGESPKTSFAQLLKGMNAKENTTEQNSKVIQNGALVLSLEDQETKIKLPTAKESKKGDTKENKSFLSLLKNEETSQSQTKELTLTNSQNNTQTNTQSSKTDVKALISDAKDYLKSKILQSDGYKISQTKELPKTLKGLTQLAQKLGIDVDKITMQEVVTNSKTSQEDIQKTKNALLDNKETKDSKSTNILKNTSLQQKVSAQNTQTQETPTQTIDKELSKEEKKLTKETSTKNDSTLNSLKTNVVKEHMTEQLVQAKQRSVKEKSPKEKVDENFKILLSSDKSSGETPTDLSTKVTAKQSSTTLEDLLKDTSQGSNEKEASNSTSTESNSKTQNVTAQKVNDLEVKINEAKQMIKYLSSDIKQEIQNYKSPFTRVKLQLNPKNLGDVDLTIVQRGKNLHVNLSSNNTAINTLAMNANELKTQLSNNGINNATLNFSNQDSNSNQNSQGQQKQQQRQAHEEYNYFETEEQNEEILSSLEIVVPRYV